MNDASLPLVSIIIPSYNHAQYIGTAIESVLNQTYTNIELIVIDDGSSDDSHAVIRKYADQDSRITPLLNTVNQGQGKVINQALAQAKGHYIGLLPSDDWYLPEKTALQIKKFQESAPEVGVVYGGGARFFEDTGETIEATSPAFTGQVASHFITYGNFVYPVTPLYRRECFELEPFDETFQAEGESIFLRFALHFEYEYVDKTVAVMRDHTYNTGKKVDFLYDDVLRYWTKFFDRKDLSPDIQALKPIPFLRIHRTKGMQFIGERQNFIAGRKCLLRAVQIKPRLLLTDAKLMAALFITFLPRFLAISLIKLYR